MQALVLTALLAAGGPTDAKKELAALTGKWQPVAMQTGDTKFTKEQLKAIEMIIEDGKYLVTANGQKDKGTLKLDTKPEVKTMDIVGTDGPNKGKTFPAIYELDGDRLKICYAMEGTKRPTEFKVAGAKTLLVVYEKVKDKK
jgi:uncharacterized protein (TIGR03067 family)